MISKVLGALALISVVLSMFVGFSVVDPAQAVLTINGRATPLPFVQKGSIGFLDGLKNGSLIIGAGIYKAGKDTIEMFQTGFHDATVFGSVWLRKFWWLLGIPISLVINIFFAVIIIFKSFVLVAVTIKGGVAYYLGLATALLLLIGLGYASEHRSEPTDSSQTPPANA